MDDITFVGSKQAVMDSLKILRARLSDLGFEMHNDSSAKSLEVPPKDWIIGRDDFRRSRREISWMTLIGDLKRFLLANPGGHQCLHQAFQSEGFRIPVRDYSSAVFERSHLEEIRRWAPTSWFRREVHKVSVDTLLSQARWLRGSYESEFRELLEGFDKASAYERKRRIPKLRYRCGRLSYLATESVLADIASMAKSIPELHLHASVMLATATGSIDQVLELGTNAAQAAAQPMRACEKRSKMTLASLSEVQQQALAVFRLNGVVVDAQVEYDTGGSELLAFSGKGATRSLMESEHPFIREIACLHGITENARHPEMLESVYDEDEDLAVDAVDQLQQSLSP